MDDLSPYYKVNKVAERNSRPFTDRIDSQKLFESFVLSPPSNKRILLYYGLGGIGKTELKEKLMKNLESLKSNAVAVEINFREHEYREPLRFLLKFKKLLSEKQKLKSPYFDLAYIIYLKRCKPEMPIQKKDLEYINPDMGILNMLGFLEEIPIAKSVMQILNWTEKIIHHINDNKMKQQEKFKNLMEMKIEDVPFVLPEFLSYDIQNHFAEQDTELIVFLDTYEALWENSRTQGAYIKRDYWVRQFILHLKESIDLFVIFSRDKLYWQEENENWEKYIELYELNHFTKEDAAEFLTNCGITNKQAQHLIIESSEGLPLILNLMVDKYKEDGSLHFTDDVKCEEERFNQSQMTQAIQRFYSYLNSVDSRTIDILSVMEFWDLSLYKAVMKKFHLAYPQYTYFEDLKRFSFIKTTNVTGKYYLDKTMKNIISKQFFQNNEQQWYNINEFLVNHYFKIYQQSFSEEALSNYYKFVNNLPDHKKTIYLTRLQREQQISTPVVFERPEERAYFQQFMNHESTFTLQYFGGSGSGKTTLKQQIAQDTHEMGKQALSLTVSTQRRDIIEVLSQLSLKIEYIYNITFPTFNNVYAIFVKRLRLKYLVSPESFDRSSEWVERIVQNMDLDMQKEYSQLVNEELRKLGVKSWLEDFNAANKESVLPSVILLDDAELLKGFEHLNKVSVFNPIKWILFTTEVNYEYHSDIYRVKKPTLDEYISFIKKSFPNMTEQEILLLWERNSTISYVQMYDLQRFIQHLLES